MQLAKASIQHLYHFQRGELETKQGAWRSAEYFLASTGMCLGEEWQTGRTSFLSSQQ